MLNLNQVNIAGNLTRDPEIRYTPKGTQVADFSLAINRAWTTDDGEKREEVVFVEVQAWGKTAETLSKYTSKGHSILVEGRLKQDSWEDKESGKKRTKMFVVCERFHFVSSPRNEGERGKSPAAANRNPPASTRPPKDPDLNPNAGEDDDIPF